MCVFLDTLSEHRLVRKEQTFPLSTFEALRVTVHRQLRTIRVRKTFEKEHTYIYVSPVEIQFNLFSSELTR